MAEVGQCGTCRWWLTDWVAYAEWVAAAPGRAGIAQCARTHPRAVAEYGVPAEAVEDVHLVTKDTYSCPWWRERRAPVALAPQGVS